MASQPPSQPPATKVAVVRVVEIDLPWKTVFWLSLKFTLCCAAITAAIWLPFVVVNSLAEAARERDRQDARQKADEAAREAIDAVRAASKDAVDAASGGS